MSGCVPVTDVTSKVLTRWGRDLLYKITVHRMVKNFLTFLRTWRSIILFTTLRHLYPSWAESIHSTSPSPISIKPILMHSTVYTYFFQVFSLHQISPTKILYTFLFLPLRAIRPSLTPTPFHPTWFEHSSNVWWEVQTVKSFIMQFTSFSNYFFPLNTKIPVSVLFCDTLDTLFSLSLTDRVS